MGYLARLRRVRDRIDWETCNRWTSGRSPTMRTCWPGTSAASSSSLSASRLIPIW